MLSLESALSFSILESCASIELVDWMAFLLHRKMRSANVRSKQESFIC
jgi:hypothetical protein